MSAPKNVSIIFDGLTSMTNVALSALTVYAVVLVLIRISGKRVTSEMNNFDWIVSVAVGSITASAILVKDVVLMDAVSAIGTLFAIQYLVTWLSVRSDAFEQLIKASPSLLVLNGQLCEDTMRSQRVSKAEIMAAVREAGLPSLDGVAAVILESDAQMSVIPASAVDGVLSDHSAADGVDPLAKGRDGDEVKSSEVRGGE